MTGPIHIKLRSAPAGTRPDAAPAQPGQPAQARDDGNATLRRLLHLEAEIRSCGSVEELGILLVNELPKMAGARQAYFLDLKGGVPRLEAASGARNLDRDAPTMRWLARELSSQPPAEGWGRPGEVRLRVGSAAAEEEGRAFPFSTGYWLPISPGRTERQFGLVLLAEQSLAAPAIAIGTRVAATAAHAATVLSYRAPRRASSPRAKLLLAAAAVALPLVLAWPVSMTALAPMEVVPEDGFVVAAPIDGVIEEIAVAPNAAVKAGDLIVRYVDTVPRNQLQLAEREMSVAEAKLRQLQQIALVDDRAKRELAQARAEWTLKIAERDFARDSFERSQVRAPRDGVAIYADRKEWVGRPVSTGQRILEIADTTKVQLRAQLPVAEVLDLSPGDRIRAYLDGDPLRPVAATVTSMSHQAKIVEGQGLAYRVEGAFASDVRPPRLGVRGTAQLYSGRVPLVYYLFRRPLIWLRQKAGL